MRARAASARVARLATVTAAGTPHVVPCCFVIEGDRLYTAVDDIKKKTTRSLRRLENVAAHPEVAVLVDHYAEDWDELWWVRIEGHARIAQPGSPEHAVAVGLLSAKYDQYRLRPPPGPATVVGITRWRAWP